MELCGYIAVEQDDALDVVLGYIFGRRQVDFRHPSLRYATPGDEQAIRPYAWAYHAFDCTPAGEGTRVTAHDVLIANALNAPLGQGDLACAMEVFDVLSNLIGEIAEGPTFIELDLPTGFPRSDAQPTGDVSWDQALHMCQAWYLLERLPGFGLAKTHKILHHKLPEHFPLIDSETEDVLREGKRRLGVDGYWAVILRDLEAPRGAELTEVRDRVTSFMDERLDASDCRRPSLLRVHDILLWCHARDWDEALEAGRGLRSQ